MNDRSRAKLAVSRMCAGLLPLCAALCACDAGDTSTAAPVANGGAPNSSGVSGAPGSAPVTASAGVGASGVGASGAGGAPVVGTGGASAGASPVSADPAQFSLLFRDDFDALDTARWEVETHSWDSNLALFSEQSVAVKDGQLKLSLLPAPSGTMDSSGAAKQFFGAEVRSTDTLTYGRVRARVKFASGSAVVSSLVTLYTPWPAANWNELDMEHLGAQPTNTQFNTMVYTGAPLTPPVTTSVTPTQEPVIQKLGFDASADFHVYAMEWTPQGATFSVDDAPIYTWTKHIDLMTLPQNVLLTIWASSSAAWAGPVTPDTANAAITYDWVELYRYTP